MNKKIISLLLLTIFAFSSVAVSAAGETLTLSPGDGDIIYDAPQTFSAYAQDAVSILFYLDGVFLGEADSGGQITAPKLSFGKHTLAAVAVMADKSAVRNESTFEYRQNVVFGKQEQDFSGFTETSSASQFGFTFGNSSLATLTPVPGPSGEEGDVAVKLEISGNDAVLSGAPYLDSREFRNYTKGIAEIEFDIKHNTKSDSVGLTSPFLWSGASLNLISGGKYAGTSLVPTTEWTHLKFVLDNDQKLVSFYVNGTPVKEAEPFGTNSYYKNSSFRLTQQQSAKTDNAVHGGYSLDNFKAINYKEYLGITNAEITDGKMKIYINEGLSTTNLSKESVTLCTRDGQTLSLSDVIYDEEAKALTLIPEYELPGGREIVATLSPELMFADDVPLGGSYEVSAMSPAKSTAGVNFQINDNALYTARQIDAGDVISAQISAENTSGEPLDTVYILTLRSNKRLVAMDSKTLKMSDGQTEIFTLALPETEMAGDYEVTLMVIDSFAGNKAIGRFIKIN